MRDHLVAVDIGTGSARAGIFDRDGRLLARAAHPILMQTRTASHAEHDSEDIWAAVTASVREAISLSGLQKHRFAAIGFDATCSLVVRGPDGAQISVSTDGETRFDTIVWLDHRAGAEAAELSASGHPALARTGGLSPEMALPKLMWLKRNRPDTWRKASGIFDLADYMTFRATGSARRSCSTMAAKWNHPAAGDADWDPALLEGAGLQDIRARASVPHGLACLGTALGNLLPEVADELGLDAACVVAPGMIDAYAGTAGLLARFAGDPGVLARQAAFIAGTSSCIVRLSHDAVPSPGYWGPFRDAVLPGWKVTEGGQSATGALLDHVVRMHAAGGRPQPELHAQIIRQITLLQQQEGHEFGRTLDVLPDFHGNRSPLGDPAAFGVVSGLTLDTTFDGLCRLYWRTAVGIACGVREIIESFETCAGEHDRPLFAGGLHMAGGHALNPLLVSLYADMTGKPILVPDMKETVLLGTAMNAASAAGLHESMASAGRAMASTCSTVAPNPARRAGYDRDYQRYLAMQRHRAELRAMP